MVSTFSAASLQAAGLSVEAANYDLIYTAPLAPDMTLEDISVRFNIDHLKDFKGHSLSTSDVVVLHQNGQDTAHYAQTATVIGKCRSFYRSRHHSLPPTPE